MSKFKLLSVANAFVHIQMDKRITWSIIYAKNFIFVILVECVLHT